MTTRTATFVVHAATGGVGEDECSLIAIDDSGLPVQQLSALFSRTTRAVSTYKPFTCINACADKEYIRGGFGTHSLIEPTVTNAKVLI